MSTSVLEASPGKFDIKRHSHGILYILASRCQQAFSKPCLVNLMSKDTHLVFSIFSTSLPMSSSILKASPGKLDIKRHSPSILYIWANRARSTSVLKASTGKLDIKRHSPSILYISAVLTMSIIVFKALPGKLDVKRHSPSILYFLASLVMSASILEALPRMIIIKDTHLLFSISRLASQCQQTFSKLCLVIFISKDTHLVFSIYLYSCCCLGFCILYPLNILYSKCIGSQFLERIIYYQYVTSPKSYSLFQSDHFRQRVLPFV